jgi:hypothetical protein
MRGLKRIKWMVSRHFPSPTYIFIHIAISKLSWDEQTSKKSTHLMPTPPATKTKLRISSIATSAGGQMKLPPTRTLNSFPRISSFGLHSHAAGGFDGDFCTASSTCGNLPCVPSGGTPSTSAESGPDPSTTGFGDGRGWASAGVDVIVNPPACGIEGIWTSSH